MQKKYTLNQLRGAIFGLATGDALGVPVEFRSREYLNENPVKAMIGYGSHNQPPGTWSDDSSLALCLLDSLCKGYDLAAIGQSFVQWFYQNLWTPHGRAFDIGNTTRDSIRNLKLGVDPQLAGMDRPENNGNGSLMRILPMAFQIMELPIEERYRYIKEVSSLTHRHIIAIMACFIYVEYAILLIEGLDKRAAYLKMQETVKNFIEDKAEFGGYGEAFQYILNQDISQLNEQLIHSSGYVLHTLEAALWCFLKYDSYSEIALKAVNLGEDTDTTGAVAGGLAGLYYGYEKIPSDWIIHLAREQDIDALCELYFEKGGF
ncbi:MAG: ADP-ribosylglycohydrolase family protein [Microscillaceae bacterium]|nr:ADP-ribosylglycohydrolase family protein [Microscillaceae bacterium]